MPALKGKPCLSLAACLIVVSALSASRGTASAAPGRATPGKYYLALGDSLAFGATAEGVPVDPTCSAQPSYGYVCLFFRYLRQQQPDLSLLNLSHPLEDSCEVLNGYGPGSPCTRALDAPIPAPLPQAIAFLQAHPGQVNPITVNIGGNDLLPLLPNAAVDPLGTAAQLPKVFSTFSKNLDSLLAQLRAAAGASTSIIVINQYNPLGGISSPPLPSGLPQIAVSAIGGMNNVVKSEAAKYSATYADVAAAFDAWPGGAAVLTFVPPTLASGDPTKLNILPTADGYRVYAGAVIRASGFMVKPTISVKVSPKSVRSGQKLHVSGTTSVYAGTTLTLTPPRGKSHKSAGQAADDGTYAFSVSVPKSKGTGHVKVCAVDLPGQKVCSSTMTYRRR
jgi:lysophospholipase L1-like esterase